MGLKLVNGAPFTAVDVVPDPVYASIAVASDVTFHLGPPLAVLLQSDAIEELAIPGLPPGTVMLRSPGFQRVTHRMGAFAMTDQKSHGKQFAEVLLNLKGTPRGTATAPRPSFMGLYVQLSRATRWEGLYLFQEPERSDFIEPKNVLDGNMKDAVARLERQGDETRECFRREHRQESWFAAWDATEPETAAAGRRRGIDNRTAP